MAQSTYIQLVNKVLTRIGGTALSSDVSSATGNASIITELINEAQNVLFSEADWQTLSTTRTFVTVSGTQNYARATLASDGADFGRGINLTDITNDKPLIEANIQDFDNIDANANSSGQPLYYAIVGSSYALYEIPNGTFTIRDRFWKVPATLSSDSDTSDLPIECEPCIINFALSRIKELLKAPIEATIYERQYAKYLEKAIASNNRKINKISVFRPTHSRHINRLPRLPSNYGRR